MVKVVLVDDHELFRMGVRSALKSHHIDISIVGEADSGAELFKLLETLTPDLILLDILLPDRLGTDIARQLKQEQPAIKILALSSENSYEIVQTMLEIGIDGFVSKRMGNVDVLAKAIRSIMSGLSYYGTDISEIIHRIYIAKRNSASVSSEFTERERQIIELCHEGLPSKLIAEQLHISPRTVDNHKNAIFRKLGINSTLEMVRYALKNGIIQLD